MPTFKIRVTIHSMDSHEGNVQTSREVRGASLMDVLREINDAIRAFRPPEDLHNAEPE